MNISSSSGVQAAVQAVQNFGSGVAAALVLKKALSSDGAVAQTLLQALPAAAPVLAVSGAVGTLVNTFA
ncbi:putative motility protein [Rhodoferax sp.]|uniref:putative motility protein n=1 Tax=Rhodoferax sp. TaxID=50421 RepID=UPI00284FFA0F|nr:putative motility protein [Rhodoferax sp.]MDR3369561.1 putative motility protein [Rhodoferax sp.]